MMPAATVRLTPAIVISRFTGAVVERALGDLAVENGKIFAEPTEFAPMPADRLPFVVGRRLALQPLPPQPIEQIGVRTLRKRGERAGSHEPSFLIRVRWRTI